MQAWEDKDHGLPKEDINWLKHDREHDPHRCGYSKTVRYIVDISGWYCMLTEVLGCNECSKASKSSSDHHMGRYLAWSNNIVSQLAPCHQQRFPAVLTQK